jgi:hypothetical protein
MPAGLVASSVASLVPRLPRRRTLARLPRRVTLARLPRRGTRASLRVFMAVHGPQRPKLLSTIRRKNVKGCPGCDAARSRSTVSSSGCCIKWLLCTYWCSTMTRRPETLRWMLDAVERTARDGARKMGRGGAKPDGTRSMGLRRRRWRRRRRRGGVI